MMEWIAENKEVVAVLTPVALDLIAGVIPDRYIPYIGMLRRALRAISKRKKGASVFVLIVVLLAAGCALTKKDRSEVCPKDADSVICESIPDPGRADILLQLANVRLLKEDQYNAEQALDFLTQCEKLIDETETYQDVARQLSRHLNEYKLEILILSGYIDTLDVDLPVSEYDRELLRAHIDRQKQLIESYAEEKGDGSG